MLDLLVFCPEVIHHSSEIIDLVLEFVVLEILFLQYPHFEVHECVFLSGRELHPLLSSAALDDLVEGLEECLNVVLAETPEFVVFF